ncbi:MAG: hypothetical protein VKJ04_11980 [Vampirovibrionales bacterium]|nr:hypothetical protein [Vampirovibrionales bacterium]
MSALRQQQATPQQASQGGALQQSASRIPLSPQQKQQLALLQRRMQKVKNQMDFAEILANFMPVSNLDALDQKMQQLNQQYASILSQKSPFQAR